MSNATELTGADFQETVSKGVSLVDFWAEWCGPCRMMGPILDELAALYEGRVTIAKVNVDANMELTTQQRVSSIPALIIFKDGAEVKRYVGLTAKGELIKTLDAQLA